MKRSWFWMTVILVALVVIILVSCSTSTERTRCIDRGGKAIYETIDDGPLMVQCAGMRGTEEVGG